MRYVAARREKRNRETAYRIYVTDALKIIAENMANRYGGHYLTYRYADRLKKPEEPKSGEDIVKEVFSKGGIEVTHGFIRSSGEDNP